MPGLFDTSGNVVPNSATTYWPYGAVRTGGIAPTAQTDKQFTGQRTEPGDSALGLYNYNARFYSTFVGMFVSADNVAGTKNDPIDLNRFAYVKDNPLRYTDPTGHCVGGLPCSPTAELNIAACAQGLDVCLEVFQAMDINPYDSNGKLSQRLLDAWQFAVAAADNPEFWRSWFDPAINPYLHGLEISQSYDNHGGWFDWETRFIGFANVTYAEHFPSTAFRIINAIGNWLSSEDCQQAVIGAIGLAGEKTDNEEIAAAADVAAIVIDALHRDSEGAGQDATEKLFNTTSAAQGFENAGGSSQQYRNLMGAIALSTVIKSTLGCIGH